MLVSPNRYVVEVIEHPGMAGKRILVRAICLDSHSGPMDGLGSGTCLLLLKGEVIVLFTIISRALTCVLRTTFFTLGVDH